MKRSRKTEIPFILFFTVLALLFFLPILLMLSISFSDADSLLEGYSFIPRKFSLEAYELLVTQKGILNAYGVSIFVTVISTVLGVAVMSMIAYVISRKDYKPARILSFLVFFTMIFTGGLVPTYIIITKYLNLRDNIWVLILPNLIAPFHIMLFKSFFTDISPELFESANMDGAGEFMIFYKIAIPISKPVIATVVLFTILRYWNDWFSAMLYISKDELIPIQFFMYRLITNFEAFEANISYYATTTNFPKEPTKMALAVVTSAPLLVVYPFLQKYFVKGITLGAVKG